MFDRHSKKATTTSAMAQNNIDPVHVNACSLLIRRPYGPKFARCLLLLREIPRRSQPPNPEPDRASDSLKSYIEGRLSVSLRIVGDSTRTLHTVGSEKSALGDQSSRKVAHTWNGSIEVARVGTKTFPIAVGSATHDV